MTLEVLDSVAPIPPQRAARAPSRPALASRERALSLESSADDLAIIRRQLRIRLLRDLVSNGLYRVPTEALAERLVAVVTRRA